MTYFQAFRIRENAARVGIAVHQLTLLIEAAIQRQTEGDPCPDWLEQDIRKAVERVAEVVAPLRDEMQ